MRRGGIGALFAFTIAILMLNGQGGSSTGSKGSAAPSAAAKSPAALVAKRGTSVLSRGICKLQPPAELSCDPCDDFCPSDDLRDTIKAFFLQTNEPESSPDSTCKLPTPPKLSDDQTQADLNSHWNVPYEFRAGLRFVIATVADPAHTHLSLSTDRQLEAIMQGAQGSHYLFARAYLPWDNQTYPVSDDFLSRLNAADWQTMKESFPGLLIFRKALPENLCEAVKPLFVFIVGERPTSGINKQQFRKALQIRDAIRKGIPPQTPGDPLLILGPSFSGSLYSLDYLLAHDPAPDNGRVIIHSGTVSSFDTISWFKKIPSRRNTQLEFRTFHESDRYMEARFLAYAVCEEHYTAHEVVILAEDETAHGYALSAADPANKTQIQKSSPEIPFTGCEVQLSQISNIFFPRDISHLRSAYQLQSQSAAATDAGNKPPRTTLPLNIEDTGNDDDTVPTYSPGQTPLSEESVLLGIASSLHQQHAKFVILVATNPLDELFLSQFLRRAYPQGRIVTFDQDLLMSREVNDPRFHGILSITSYPLFPGLKDHVALPKDLPQGPDQHHQFPWDAGVSTYNAMVSLLVAETQQACDPSKSCWNPPSKCPDLASTEKLAQYGWPALGGMEEPAKDTLAPPLWLTVIGNDGYWPLAILDSKLYADHGGAPGSLLHAIHPTASVAQFGLRHRPWDMLCAIFLGGMVIYLYLRWSGTLIAPSKLVANFAPVDDSFSSYGLFIADVMFLSILLLLLCPWHYPPFQFGESALQYLLWLFFFLLLGSSILDLHRRGARTLATISMIFVPVIAIFVWFMLDRGPAASQNLFFYRFVHITSGVSPLIPMLVLGISGIWWAWFTLAGLVLSGKRGPQLPSPPPVNDTVGNTSTTSLRFRSLTSQANEHLLCVIKPTCLDYRVILVPILCLMLSIFLIDFSHPVRSIEAQSYDYVYSLFFGLALFVLLCDLFRLVVAWIELRGMLGSLNRLTLRRCFDGLGDLKGKQIWQLGSSAYEDYSLLLTKELEAVGKLKKYLTSADEPLCEEIRRLDLETANLMNSVVELRNVPLSFAKNDLEANLLGELFKWHQQLASVCWQTLLYLTNRWSKETPIPAHLPESPEPVTECRFTRDALPQSTLTAENFVCLFYFNFLSSIFLRLRSLLMSVAGMFVFLVLSFNCYPFEPKSTYHLLMVFVFLVIVTLVAFVMGQMHRDPTISQITNTTPGELGWDFWLRMASFVALPLITLLSSQFPEIGNFLFSWAQPTLSNIK